MALDFDHLLGLHTGEWADYLIVREIDSLVAAALGASTQKVFLSAHTIQKQIDHHKEMPISAYRVLGPCLVFGEYRQDTVRTAIVLFVDTVLTNRYYRAYIKATNAGDELFLQSFHPVNARVHIADRRKWPQVIRPHIEL
jgi:hypothetical protein